MLEASALDSAANRPDSRLRFDQRILLLALAAGFPAAVVALILLWTGDYTPKVQWTLTVFVVGVWTGCSFSVRHRVVLPLQTLSNLLAALRESDFSIRARGASGDDPLGAVMLEVNVLASTLHDQRLGALEAGALLRTVMVEIDVAVFTFDGAQTLRLVNRAGERLLGAAGRAAARAHRRRARAGRVPRRTLAAHRGRRVSRRVRTLGSAAHDVPPGRPPAPAARARRRQPAAARRGAPGVAAADSRDRPRDQQLARADQVDRRQPRVDARARRDARRTGTTT